ncbi:hypothetical protein BDB01DRAFT_873109 [Pilobolus umbonatus]|nr:hypothetical protein BDB01DRAFT_873109 [Pilobolus umbonatus]
MFFLFSTRLCLPSRRLFALRHLVTKEGPKKDKLKAIPFTQPVRSADQVFDKYHGSGFFSIRISDIKPPEQAFLPFWVVSATVNATIEQGQVGRRVIRSRYNASTKRTETYWDTEWAWIPRKFNFTRDYDPTAHSQLQIYGSHRYSRGIIQKITTGRALEDAIPFNTAMLDRPDDPQPRRVDPYLIYPTTALRFAQSYMKSQEERLADEFLRRVYKMDETRLLKISIQLEDIQVSPVYYPAYVYTVSYLGRNLRTFINGRDLSIGGTKIYNWERVAMVTAAGMATTMLMTGGIGWGGASGSFWIGIVLPTLVTSAITMYYPILSLYARDLLRDMEIKTAAQDADTWDDDWVKGYTAFEYQERKRNWQEEKERKSWYSSSKGENDPKDYYKELGVSKDASQSDIQSAFRGLAMKYHPDRFTDPEEKKKAKEKFQKISAAYSVLRDSKRNVKESLYYITNHIPSTSRQETKAI